MDQQAKRNGNTLDSCCVVSVEVTVCGLDLSGLPFLDKCNTTAIAGNGAIVTIARALGLEQEIVLHFKDTEISARVIGHSGNGNYGVCFDKTCPEFWNGLADVSEDTDPLLITSNEQFDQPAAQTRSVERRRSARIKMRQAKACVELPDGTQDLVELRDVSRGGVCFCSSHFYPLNSFIRVAAPFTPGGNNLFVDARIVHINRSGIGQDYGAEYIR